MRLLGSKLKPMRVHKPETQERAMFVLFVLLTTFEKALRMSTPWDKDTDPCCYQLSILITDAKPTGVM